MNLSTDVDRWEKLRVYRKRYTRRIPAAAVRIDPRDFVRICSRRENVYDIYYTSRDRKEIGRARGALYCARSRYNVRATCNRKTLLIIANHLARRSHNRFYSQTFDLFLPRFSSSVYFSLNARDGPRASRASERARNTQTSLSYYNIIGSSERRDTRAR